jgi:hypothetical protein
MAILDLVSISKPLTSAVSGPLQALYSNDRPSLAPLVYPSDLGSSTKNHYVKFWVKQIVKSDAVVLPSTWDDAVKDAKSVAERIQTLNYQPETSLTQAVICLYMPDTLNASYNASYDELSLTNDLGKGILALQAISSVYDYVKSGNKTAAQQSSVEALEVAAGAAGVNALLNRIGLGGQELTNISLQSQGFAINPQLQVIYRGVGFRKFQLNFLFTPASEDEALAVNRIIGTFKYHFAPDLVNLTNSSGGMFFVPPSFFNVEFMFNNNENKFLPRYGDCVLTNIDVNFAPNGFAAHNDGAPVQTSLTLEFQEIEIVTKAKIAAGYNADQDSPFSSAQSTIAGLR